jgi:hypothetical protein
VNMLSLLLLLLWWWYVSVPSLSIEQMYITSGMCDVARWGYRVVKLWLIWEGWVNEKIFYWLESYLMVSKRQQALVYVGICIL